MIASICTFLEEGKGTGVEKQSLYMYVCMCDLILVEFDRAEVITEKCPRQTVDLPVVYVAG